MPDASIPPRDDMPFEQVFREHAAFAGRVLRRFGVQPRDVEDAAQDVFVVVHRRLPELEHPAALRTWLYRICARVAADYRKRAHRRYERLDEAATDTPVAHEQEGHARHAQLVAQLERTLDALADEQRQVFVLFELEELRMSEVAELLSCPLKTAFSRLYAARREVRADLRRAGFSCVTWALWSLSHWKASAAVELHAALQALGASGGASGVAGSAAASTALPAGALAIAPLAKTAPQLLYTGSAVAGWSYVSSVASATGLLTVLMLGLSPLVPADGVSLVDARAASDHNRAEARRTPYRITPRSIPLALPPPEPTPPRPLRASDPHARSPRPEPWRSPSAPDATAAAVLPAATHAPPQHDWIRAPAPEPAPLSAARASASASPRPSAVGLDDEVLAATSVESLMRLVPARGAARSRWALVPAAPAAPPAIAASSRRAPSARRSDR